MIIINKSKSNAKQAVMPILISDYLDICDPVLTFDRFMEEMDLEKYLKGIPNTIREDSDITRSAC